MEKLRWGIIGPGNIAQSFITDLALVTGCSNSVIAVMSNHTDTAEEFARAHFIPYYFNNIPEMLEKASPDIVYVASPHPAHYKESLLCLQHHIPVICEKPLAMNHRQVQSMTAAAYDNHTFLLEGMWIRFLPSIHQLRDLLSGGVIGRINSIVADMSYLAPKNEENRFYNPGLGGGSLLDLGIYPVYLALLILGNPDGIKAAARLSARGIDESCAAILTYDDGAYALAESSIIKNSENQARVYGEKGVITLLKPWNEKPEAITVSLYDGTTLQYPCQWKGRGFQFEITEAIHCLSDGLIESRQHTHADSLRLMETLDKIRIQAHIAYPSD